MPCLYLQVLAHNKKAAESSTKINLKGILVGNGVTGQGSIPEDVGAKMDVEFFFGHGLFNNSLHGAIVDACGDFKTPSQRCEELQGTMHEQLGDVNVYDIYWPCKHGGMEGGYSPATQLDAASAGMGMRGAKLALAQQARAQGSKGGLREGGPVACIDASAAALYLNHPVVQKARPAQNPILVRLGLCGVHS